jgi:hypothetical protein
MLGKSTVKTAEGLELNGFSVGVCVCVCVCVGVCVCVFRDPAKYIFNTEAHLLALPQAPAKEFLISPTNPPDYTRRRKRIDSNGRYKPKNREKKKEVKKKEHKDEI